MSALTEEHVREVTRALDAINPSLREICFTYLLKNDKGHQWPHIVDVANVGVYLANTYGLDKLSFLLAAVCHDIFSTADRVRHHELSHDWVLGNLDRFGYGAVKERVALMCAQHRASYKGEYAGIYQECFAAADRGIPSYAKMLRRSYQYGIDTEKLSHDEGVVHAWEHLKDKYGSKGYARWPETSLKYFGDHIAAVKVTADTASLDSVKRILMG